MTATLLRRAAETMRREESEFFDRLADWLEETARYADGSARHDTDIPFAVATAEAYLADPGELPEAITGGVS